MTRYFRQLYGFFTASFKALLRNPFAWLFGFAFPLVFILLFGFISNENAVSVNVGFIKDDSDLYQPIKEAFTTIEAFNVTENEDFEVLNQELENGDIDGIIRFLPDDQVELIFNANKPENFSIISQTLDKVNTEITFEAFKLERRSFEVQIQEINSRETRYIDFVLPGILGYSIMSAAVFGVAYSLLELRKTNVLKRLFAGPSKPSAFILGESLSRSIYILAQVIALISVAALAFRFSPRDGFEAYWQMGIVIIIGLIVFLGIGYVIAGVAKSDEVVAPVANLVVLPQFILAGTFFPLNALPNWLSFISQLMPLYHFNQSIRLITIDGYNLWDQQVFIWVSFLILWGVLIYILASSLFRVK